MSDLEQQPGPAQHPDAAGAPPAPKPEKKRRRPALSCEQCRRRKIRCDRNVPCNHCVKSGIPACSYAPTHTPASKTKKQQQQQPPPLVPRDGDARPPSLQPAPAAAGGTHNTGLPSPSSEYIGPAEFPRAPRAAAAASPSGSGAPGAGAGAGAATGGASVDWLVARVQQLEENLADALHISDRREAGPGEGVLEAKDVDTALPVKGTLSKTRYFGQSHWMNGADLFPIQLGLLNRSEMEKSEMFVTLNKCKTLARTIKERRLRPLSSAHLGAQMPARELADALVDTYLRTFEGVLRIVHVPSFRAEYDRYWHDPASVGDHFPIQLQLCMALGATLHDDAFSLRATATQWVYEAQLWLLLPPEKSRMTIAGIQIMCLLMLAKAACAVGHDLTFVTAGALVRKAMYMGLHRDPRRLANMTRFRAEMRRRLWATILELNLQSSFDAGGSPLLFAPDYDTRPPANMDDDQLDNEPDDGDDEARRPVSDDVPTQTSTQRALLRSLALRTNLLRHINSIQTADSYTETLRYNSELTKACLAVSQGLAALSRSKKRRAGSVAAAAAAPEPQSAVRAFHMHVAELFMYRCFHALHQPVMAKSLDDPKYYFSRKMCLDSALKIAHACGLSGAGGVKTSSLPRGSDVRRLLVNAAGVFRNVPVQSMFGITAALVHSGPERASGLGYLPSLGGEADLRACMEASLGWMMERIGSGETNIKGACFLAACLAQIDAAAAGADVEAAIVDGTTESTRQCWVALQELARTEGVPLDDVADGAFGGRAEPEAAGPEAGAGPEMDGVAAALGLGDDWMADLAWDDVNMGWPQGPFDEMSPMFSIGF